MSLIKKNNLEKCSQEGAWEQAPVYIDRYKAPALERKSSFFEWTH
jgi:hypothetical protein